MIYLNTVEPIKDFELILDIQDYLKCKQDKRDYVLFMFGIYSGLRISDILALKVRDVRNADFIYITEQKTNKIRKIVINDALKAVIKEYIKTKRDYEYLFTSSRGEKNKPLTRQRVWQILNNVARVFDYKHPMGCHTLRKTFGYWLYQDTKDAASIMDILNHSDISITKRYIGVTQESNENMMRNLSFSKKR